ncbi:Hypp4643 [Branchiostoma lanceolatum]|uniref:Hypp4643 protein n=1 Tax=Branchiostoma lanceolatum TaxID=7740 RepID=A0A8K0A9B8_BRALA|nr:Hypp4643 [Branchiostoma lanceolatum]
MLADGPRAIVAMVCAHSACVFVMESLSAHGNGRLDQGERNILPDIDVITDKLLNEQQTTAGKYDEGNNHVEELRGEQTTTQREQQGSSPQAKPQKNTPPAATQYAHGINDILFLAIVVGCSVLGVIGLGIAGYCWWKGRHQCFFLLIVLSSYNFLVFFLVFIFKSVVQE